MKVRRISTSIESYGLLLALALVSSVSGYSQPRDPDTVTVLGTTVPPVNGDVNPYGVALVPRTIGKLVEGRFLVSNFNDAAGAQGTGTTIVQMHADGTQDLFTQINPNDAKVAGCTGGGGANPLTIGLTTALVALQSGFVVVGSLPTADGTSATAEAGCLIILDSQGNVVETITGHNINGPWDMTAVDGGGVFVLFVTNVLNGTVAAGGSNVDQGTVVRLLFAIPPGGNPKLLNDTVIADNFPERTDPLALVIGPTGVAFDPLTGNLLVADSIDNVIAAIPNALFRQGADHNPQAVSSGGALNDPLGVSLLGRNLYVANGDDGRIVEINIDSGKQIDADFVDMTPGPPPNTERGFGALFGLWAVDGKVYFVDDDTNMWEVQH
jgi:hypothetical protein